MILDLSYHTLFTNINFFQLYFVLSIYPKFLFSDFRLQTERLAAKKAKEDPEGARFVTSPAADLADYRTYLKKEEEVKEEEKETEKEEETEKKEETEKEEMKDNNGDEKEIKKEVKQEDIKAE